MGEPSRDEADGAAGDERPNEGESANRPSLIEGGPQTLRELFGTLGLVGRLGLVVALSVLGGLAAGWFLGEALGARKALMVGGTLLGVAAGFFGAGKILLREISRGPAPTKGEAKSENGRRHSQDG